MEYISVFDMLKIGVGPSSSHTLGPWRAAEIFLKELRSQNLFDKTEKVTIELYGSLSLTGKGHATDLAAMLGLSGADPEYVPVENIESIIQTIRENRKRKLGGAKAIVFSVAAGRVFHKTVLPCHANGLICEAHTSDKTEYTSTLYSVGGGFVVKGGEVSSSEARDMKPVPYAVNAAE